MSRPDPSNVLSGERAIQNTGSRPRVCAVICTYNRRELLLECLDALAIQTVPLARVIIVDNGSTDGTLAAVASSAAARQLDIGYIELAENIGSAGGFAEAITQAIDEEYDWLWVLDNDCMPYPDALATLLDSPKAASADTVALCTATRSVHGHFQTEYRGLYRKGKPAPLGDDVYERPAVKVDYAGFAGLLVRAHVARKVGPPKAEFFLWVDDLEWCLRLTRHGSIWLVPGSIILHKDGNPQIPHSRVANLRRALRGMPDSEVWKHIYCFRNMSWIRMQYEREGRIGFARHLAAHWFRVLVFDRHKWRRLRWYLDYGLAGRHSEFRNAPPEMWTTRGGSPGGYEAVRAASVPSVTGKRLRGPFAPTGE